MCTNIMQFSFLFGYLHNKKKKYLFVPIQIKLTYKLKLKTFYSNAFHLMCFSNKTKTLILCEIIKFQND